MGDDESFGDGEAHSRADGQAVVAAGCACGRATVCDVENTSQFVLGNSWAGIIDSEVGVSIVSADRDHNRAAGRGVQRGAGRCA